MQTRRYYCRLMLPNELPEIINPVKLCQQKRKGTLLSGIIYVSRLTDFQYGCDQPADRVINVKLEFLVDENGHNKIEGYVQGSIGLTCQRCLAFFDYDFQQAICVSPVASFEAAKDLPDYFEPLLLTDGIVRLTDWMAEELNLALPITPCHADGCPSDRDRPVVQDRKDSAEQVENTRVFPFKQLKRIIEKS